MSTESPTTAAPILTAKDAIARHVQWKIRLQLAIRMREPLAPSATQAIKHPDECSIGQWLLSPRTIGIRRTLEYQTLVSRHEEFHREMLYIAELINRGDFAAAERGLGPDSRFRKAAMAIAGAISAVDRIQTIAFTH